jgi:hypothetical protein
MAVELALVLVVLRARGPICAWSAGATSEAKISSVITFEQTLPIVPHRL